MTRAHESKAFVTQAIAHARVQSLVPLVHKGFRTTSVLLLGGTCIVFETPSLREDRRGRRGRRRGKRGPRGAGCSPELEALGIADRVSPATRSEGALHVVQAASYHEAAEMLARRGLACDVSSLVRISTAMAEASTGLRDAALEVALRVPVPRDGPLAGKRVRVSLDGGGCVSAVPIVGGRRPRDGMASRRRGASRVCSSWMSSTPRGSPIVCACRSMMRS